MISIYALDSLFETWIKTHSNLHTLDILCCRSFVVSLRKDIPQKRNLKLPLGSAS